MELGEEELPLWDCRCRRLCAFYFECCGWELSFFFSEPVVYFVALFILEDLWQEKRRQRRDKQFYIYMTPLPRHKIRGAEELRGKEVDSCQC
jgi:hypothetical protein